MILFQGNAQANGYGWPDGVAAKDPSRYGQVPDPLGAYPTVWHTQVRPGDNNVGGSGTGERCEGLATLGPIGDAVRGVEGRTLFYGWDVVYGDGFAPNGSDWNNSGQWHNSGSSGATCAVITPDSSVQFLVAPGNTGKDRYTLVAERLPMRRYEWLFGFTWSADPAKGAVTAWVDGALVVPATKCQTLYDGQTTYPKLGEYRTAQNWVGDSYFHGYTIATTPSECVAAFTKSAHAEAWSKIGLPPPPPDRFASARSKVELFRKSSPNIAAAFDETFKALGQ